MEMTMYFGDDDLRQQMETMDQLSQLKLTLGAVNYLEGLRNEVLADNLYNTEKKMGRQQEPITEKSRIVILKIQAELLKRILPFNRNSQMAVKWMKTIKHSHLKMVNIHKELLRKFQQPDGGLSEEFPIDLKENNRSVNMTKQREEKLSLLEPVTDKKKILINQIQVDLLRTILPMDRDARMAVKFMRNIRDNRIKLFAMQEELLNYLKEREDNSMEESLRKLENVNQTKWEATLNEWDKWKRCRMLFAIFVDQVRRIRSRRCPQMAGKMMKKLQDRQLILENLQREIVKRVEDRNNVRQKKETVQKELMTKIKRKEEMKERRKGLEMDTVSCPLERDIEDNHFVPRKLFLTGVEMFKSVSKPKIAASVENREIEKPTISSSLSTHGDKTEKNLKRQVKPKSTLKNRLKRLFGFH